MIRLRNEQPSVWEGLFAEEVAELWEPWMQVVDELLEDEELVDVVYEAQGKRHPQSRTRGRQQTPAEVALRMLILKHVRNWSYEVLEREVRANVVYRSFCRIGTEKVPDAKTLVRLGQAIGGETIRELHDRIIALARERKVVQGRKMRVDTTVVETNVHYPTDSDLLDDGARVLTRTMKKIEQKAGRLKEEGAQPDAQREQTGHRDWVRGAPQGTGRGAEARTGVPATGALNAADSQRQPQGVAGSCRDAISATEAGAIAGRTTASHMGESAPSGTADQGTDLRWSNAIPRQTLEYL